jgi:hypothetical protein
MKRVKANFRVKQFLPMKISREFDIPTDWKELTIKQFSLVHSFRKNSIPDREFLKQFIPDFPKKEEILEKDKIAIVEKLFFLLADIPLDFFHMKDLFGHQSRLDDLDSVPLGKILRCQDWYVEYRKKKDPEVLNTFIASIFNPFPVKKDTKVTDYSGEFRFLPVGMKEAIILNWELYMLSIFDKFPQVANNWSPTGHAYHPWSWKDVFYKSLNKNREYFDWTCLHPAGEVLRLLDFGLRNTPNPYVEDIIKQMIYLENSKN